MKLMVIICDACGNDIRNNDISDHVIDCPKHSLYPRTVLPLDGPRDIR